jgi:hypothetical protein
MSLASRRKDIKWGKSIIDGRANPNFNGGQYVDDKGYLRVLRSEHPYNNHGYIYMHRLVMEKVLGRYLEPWEAVHHINEIKLDNRLDNLYLTTPAEHSAIHRTGKRKTLEEKTHMRNKVRNKRKKSGPTKRNSSGQFAKSD